MSNSWCRIAAVEIWTLLQSKPSGFWFSAIVSDQLPALWPIFHWAHLSVQWPHSCWNSFEKVAVYFMTPNCKDCTKKQKKKTHIIIPHHHTETGMTSYGCSDVKLGKFLVTGLHLRIICASETLNSEKNMKVVFLFSWSLIPLLTVNA